MVKSKVSDELDDYISRLRTKKDAKDDSSASQDHKEEKVPTIESGKVYIIRKPKSPLQKLKERFSGRRVEEDFEMHKSTSQEGSEAEFENEFQEFVEEEKPSFFDRFLDFFGAPRKVDEAVEDYDKEEEMKDKTYVEQELKEKEWGETETEVEYEEERISFLERIKKIFVREKVPAYIEEEIEEEIEDHSVKDREKIRELETDLREVAIIATEVMKNLTPKKMKELKASDNFKKFKTLLSKHQIIKEK